MPRPNRVSRRVRAALSLYAVSDICSGGQRTRHHLVFHFSPTTSRAFLPVSRQHRSRPPLFPGPKRVASCLGRHHYMQCVRMDVKGAVPVDVQAMKRMRHLYQADPEFRRALQDDPAAALVRWDLASSETARDLAGTLRRLLDLSPEGILASVLEVDLPDWWLMSSGSVVSR